MRTSISFSHQEQGSRNSEKAELSFQTSEVSLSDWFGSVSVSISLAIIWIVNPIYSTTMS